MASTRYEGSVLGGTYRLESRIGKGGMGVVYKARHVRLPRQFAIKILNPDLAADDEQLQRFQSEAEIACRVAHSHVVEVFDFNRTDDGLAYIVMELLDGQDLAARLRSAGRLPLSEVLPILLQATDALEATHARGIIHRDLKPQNIFLCRQEGRRDIVKVLDFGLAKLLQGKRRTRTGMVFGTAAYMAPEQAMTGFAEVGVQTDVWALGVILYECLTGTLPFAAHTVHATLQAICYRDPKPPRQHDGDIPEAVESAVLKALRKRPEERHPSAAALRDAFSAACESAWKFAVGSSDTMPRPDDLAEKKTREFVRGSSRNDSPDPNALALADTAPKETGANPAARAIASETSTTVAEASRLSQERTIEDPPPNPDDFEPTRQRNEPIPTPVPSAVPVPALAAAVPPRSHSAAAGRRLAAAGALAGLAAVAVAIILLSRDSGERRSAPDEATTVETNSTPQAQPPSPQPASSGAAPSPQPSVEPATPAPPPSTRVEAASGTDASIAAEEPAAAARDAGEPPEPKARRTGDRVTSPRATPASPTPRPSTKRQQPKNDWDPNSTSLPEG